MIRGKQRWLCKSCGCFYTRRSKKKANKLWIWKATATLTGTTRLVNVQVGDRSARTLKPLYQRLEQRLPGVFYASDDFKVYNQVLSQNRHVVGKDLTYYTEQHNSDT